MSKWISGKDLIEEMGLDAFELLELVIKGLQPHDQSYKPIPLPDTQEKQTELRELREELKVWNSRCSSGGRLTYQEYMGPYSNLKLPKQKGPILSTHGSDSDRVEYLERGIKRIEAKIEILKGELQTLNTVSWTKYELSDDNATVEAVINCLIAYNYKSDEVEEIIDLQTQTVGMPESKNDLIAISFYQDNDVCKIGEKGAEKTLNHLKGFEYIAFIIRHKNDSFTALEVYHFGDIPEELKYLNKIDYQKIGNTSVLKKSIKNLEEGLEVEIDPNKRIEIEYKISELGKIKNERFKNFKQKSHSCRINVYKNIKAAAEAIQKKLPTIKENFNYGRSKVIKTGGTFSYQQDNFKLSVHWVLNKPS
jgi:hypothetical protein